jgi:hypothetical protein
LWTIRRSASSFTVSEMPASPAYYSFINLCSNIKPHYILRTKQPLRLAPTGNLTTTSGRSKTTTTACCRHWYLSHRRGLLSCVPKPTPPARTTPLRMTGTPRRRNQNVTPHERILPLASLLYYHQQIRRKRHRQMLLFPRIRSLGRSTPPTAAPPSAHASAICPAP